MSTQKAIQRSFQCLNTVYLDGAFGNITLNNVLNKTDAQDKPLVTKIVYGVLDNDLWLNYCIKKFATSVDSSVMVLLKIGTFCITKLNLPSAVAVNDCVEVLKKQGKKGLSGFVNAVLRNITRANQQNQLDLPADTLKDISIKYSMPLWAVEKIANSYGKQVALDFCSYRATPQTTIRVNLQKNSMESVQKLLDDKSIKWQPTTLPDALSVFGDVTEVTEQTASTPMSLSAMLVAREINPTDNDKILDCCAAPGGKSVYMANLCPTAHVTSCDIYPHKIKLIEGYAKKMGATNLKAIVNDATVLKPDFVDAFDKVLLDAPCSGFGVLQSRPDVKVFRKKSDITELAKLQSQMLSVAKNYVKKGGLLVYSTCTIFEEENSLNVQNFLAQNPNFEISQNLSQVKTAISDKIGVQLMPYLHGIDGFYYAVLKRKQ
ncbi:MAG: 16S rRNA (cytosine(967)-C(5))-methyltransferase RsmB, partial [Clostridia bacterium]|nr:16S rRNA (cytosine(967)-C(5))-methyltransferase RsmB [Clostridia bacterium]